MEYPAEAEPQATGPGGSRAWREWGTGRVCSMGSVSFRGDGNASELDRGAAYLTLDALEAPELSTVKWFMFCGSPLNQKKSL